MKYEVQTLPYPKPPSFQCNAQLNVFIYFYNIIVAKLTHLHLHLTYNSTILCLHFDFPDHDAHQTNTDSIYPFQMSKSKCANSQNVCYNYGTIAAVRSSDPLHEVLPMTVVYAYSIMQLRYIMSVGRYITR